MLSAFAYDFDAVEVHAAGPGRAVDRRGVVASLDPAVNRTRHFAAQHVYYYHAHAGSLRQGIPDVRRRVERVRMVAAEFEVFRPGVGNEAEDVGRRAPAGIRKFEISPPRKDRGDP